MIGKTLQNEFFNRVLAPGTYLDRFLLQNCAISTNQTSISTFLDSIRPRFTVFLDFSIKFSTIFAPGIATPYRKPIFATPGYHPLL